jgi:hypothetical protein
MSATPLLLTGPSCAVPFDPLLELRWAIATERAVMAFEAKHGH